MSGAPTGYELAADGTLLRSEARSWLRGLGLTRLDDVFAAPGEARGPVKSLVRVSAPDGTVVFVKRYDYNRAETWVRGALKLNFPVWSGPQELANLIALGAAGLRVPVPLAAGERDEGVRRRSFVALAQLRGRPLDAVLRPERLDDQRSLLRTVARTVGALHGAGFWHKDLYLCNLFHDSELGLGLLDCERVERQEGGPPLRWVVKDLAALDYSASWPSERERLRFLRRYLGRPLGREGRRLAHAVRHKAQLMARKGAKGP